MPKPHTVPNFERLDQIALFIARVRIAKGVSQSELASRLGVSKEVVTRYEGRRNIQAVAITRLQQILEDIGINAIVPLSA